MKTVHDAFEPVPGLHWKRYVVGAGALEPAGSALRFVITDASLKRYSNAQIDDYQGLSRRHFYWHPPLKLTVRARFSHPTEGDSTTAERPRELRGTAGFGFWNDPFLMTGARLPTLPRAAWFFYASPPSNMKLDLQTPGYGWKAATLDTLRPAALLLAPLAPLAVPLMNFRSLYRRLWPSLQRALKVREALLAVDTMQWRTYVLEWGVARTRFSVIGEGDRSTMPVLDAPSPGGPLGFVMWMDNQYMVVTPWGRLGWGLLDVPGQQWMEVDKLAIEPSL